MSEPRVGRIGLEAAPGETELSYLLREGPGVPVVYLHGLGSSKADFMGALDPAGLPSHLLLALDFPGCGGSPPVRPTPGMEQLATLAATAMEALLPRPPVLVGHSMGGLVALLVASRGTLPIRGLISIEGNLAPEDCFLSRRATEWRRRGGSPPSAFLEALMAEQRSSELPGHAQYSERAPKEVTGDVFVDYSESIVQHSDHGRLLELMLGLEIPRAFVHGAANGDLSYLPRLREAGVIVESVPASAHFPQYSNPPAFHSAIRRLLSRWEAEGAGRPGTG